MTYLMKHSTLFAQVTVTNQSRGTIFSKTLGEAQGKVAQTLLGGHAPSIGTVVLAMEAVKDAIFTSFLESINRECSLLCQSTTISRFRHIPPDEMVPPDEMASFKWDELMDELRSNSPLLLKVLTSVAVRNDHRNKKRSVQLITQGLLPPPSSALPRPPNSPF